MNPSKMEGCRGPVTHGSVWIFCLMAWMMELSSKWIESLLMRLFSSVITRSLTAGPRALPFLLLARMMEWLQVTPTRRCQWMLRMITMISMVLFSMVRIVVCSSVIALGCR